MPTQTCPNCSRSHDVGIYVSGQRVLCACGIRFEVKRSDVSTVGVGKATPSRVVTTTPQRKLSGAAVPALQPSEAVAAESPPPPVVEVLPPPTNAAAPNEAIGFDRTLVRPESAQKKVEETGPSAVEATQLPANKPSIPGYALVEILGRGGMGEVWRATQMSLGRTVAVKVLPSRLAKDPEFVARFDKEATALASLSHPNVIQIIDRGVAGDQYYFVMEFVPGRALRDAMGPSAMPAQDALKLCAQICRAIDYAHEKGIIHRDLKPENILVDDRGHVKVADFGLAGIRGPQAPDHLTATSVAMGTVNYMAPEQRRDARNVDGRADLYSLGVILYELLTGELPIGRFRLPSQKIPSIDPRVDEVVGKMLETDPAHRYQNAGEVSAALEEIVGSSVTPTASTVRKLSNPAVPAATGQPSKNTSVIQSGFRGVKLFLMVVGGLGVLGFLTNFFFGTKDLFTVSTGSGSKLTVATSGIKVDPSTKKGPTVPFPPNSEGDLFSAVSETDIGEGRTQLEFSFVPGDEKFNVHAGDWQLKDGVLHAVQAGNESDGKQLIPRAYVAHHYFNADDLTIEADVKVHGVDDRYAIEDDAQRFAEIAFRIRDLQVSVFVIRGTGMRLLWRYYTPDGVEVTGNSAKDLELMVEDEMPAPVDGATVHLKLQLKKGKKGTEVEAYANRQRFARKVLTGLEGQVGKVALGCRNLECSFSNLKVVGKAEERPKARN